MAKILVTWLASEVKLRCLSYPYYFEMQDVCECDIIAYSSLTKHPYLCLSHHFLYILYIA